MKHRSQKKLHANGNSGKKAPESSRTPGHHRNKSKKVVTPLPRNIPQPNSAPNQRFKGWRGGMQSHNLVPPQRRNYKFRELDPAKLDDLTLRDAIKAAEHSVKVANLKKQKAGKLSCIADLAIRKASSAMMLADAIKAASSNTTSNSRSEN